MMSVFGGSAVQPSDVGYRAVTLAANVVLVWPFQSQSATDFAARTMDVSATAGGLTLGLPDASTVSVGYDMLITNKGATAFTVTGNTGVVLATLAPGQSKYFYISDNTLPAGVWGIVLFGSSSNNLDAGALAGLGLAAFGATLATAPLVTSFSANYAITANDRSKVYVWTGGTGTLTLPLTNTVGVGNNFAFELRNAGTGVLTVAATGADTVDAAASIALQPTESAFVHSNGATLWYTVGRGRSTQFNFTLLVKNVAGGTTTLTPTEAANVVHRYTGALVSNETLVLPSVVQIYYVSNQTTGAFSFTFKTAGVGTTVTVPTNANAVLFCDGVNVVNTSTTVSGLSSLILAQGTVGAPSISYSGDTSTGIYQPTTGAVAIAGAGVQLALFNATGLTLSGQLAVTGVATFTANLIAAAAPTIGTHLTNKTYVDSLVGGGGYLPLTAGSGFPLSGTLYNTAAEAERYKNDGAFVSFYNSAGSTRTGYLLGAAGTSMTLAAENGAGIIIATAGSVRLAIDPSGNATFLGGRLKSSAAFAPDYSSTSGYLSNNSVMFVDSTRSANNKETELLWSSSVLQLRFLNDAYSAATSIMNVSGGQATGVSSIDFFSGASLPSLRLSNQRANFSTRATDDATYQLQVTGLGQTVAAITDAGVKGGVLYLLDTGTAGAGQGGALLFGAFGSATPMAGIKSVITNGAGNTQGDLVFLYRKVQTDIALTEAFRIASSPNGQSTFSAGVATRPSAIGNSATAFTLDCSLSNVFTLTMTGNVLAAGWTISNVQDGQTVNLFITQDGTGTRTLGWPASFKWAGGVTGVISTAPNTVDLLVLTYRAATGFWYAALSKAFA